MKAATEPRADWPAIADDVAVALLGKPTMRTKRELRFGRRGSMSVDIVRGRWFDHEAGEGGGVLDLVMRERGSIRRSLEWLTAAGFIEGRVPQNRASAPSGPKRPCERPETDPDLTTGPDPRTTFARDLWHLGIPADDTLGRAYLAGRFAWPPFDAGPPLPPSVRWLAADRVPARAPDRAVNWRGLPGGSCGALMFAWYRAAEFFPAAVSLVAVTNAAERLHWFGERRVKIRTVGPTSGTIFEARSGIPEDPAHLTEGEISAMTLSLAPWCDRGGVFAAGSVGRVRRAVALLGGPERPVIAHLDGDAAGRSASLTLSEAARIVHYGPSEDPADVFAGFVGERVGLRIADGASREDADRGVWSDLFSSTI